MSINELETRLEEWLLEQELQELAKRTLSSYRNGVMHFINWFRKYEYKDCEVNKFTTMKYKKYLMKLSNPISTKNSWITAISKYLRWLGGEDLAIKVFRQQKRFFNERTLEAKDYNRMLRIAKKHNMMMYYYIIKTLAMTGIRVDELHAFTVGSLKEGFNLRPYNKDKERVVPVRQDLRRELLAYCEQNNITNGFIFRGRKPGNMPAQSTIWRNVKKIAGLARINKDLAHPHEFRHLFARQFLEAYPDNPLDLADILGHADLKTTRRYTTSSTEQQRKKIEKMKY